MAKEMAAQITKRRDVLARWAYSEAESRYDHLQGMKALRARRSGGVSFDDLSDDDRDYLATACAQVRGPLMKYFGASDSFRLTALTRDRLGALRVPPWWQASAETCVSFAE